MQVDVFQGIAPPVPVSQRTLQSGARFNVLLIGSHVGDPIGIGRQVSYFLAEPKKKLAAVLFRHEAAEKPLVVGEHIPATVDPAPLGPVQQFMGKFLFKIGK